jgi:hypothetical protein
LQRFDCILLVLLLLTPLLLPLSQTLLHLITSP